MFEVEIDGKIENHEIRYFNRGIGLGDEDKAKEIRPNEEYWVGVFDSRPITDLDPAYWAAEKVDFFKKYWVPIDLFSLTEAMCTKLGIPVEHAHDIVVPLSDYGMAHFNPLGNDVQEVANESLKLREIMEALLEEPLLAVTGLTIEVGYGPLGGADGRVRFQSKRKVSIQNHRALLPLFSELRRILKSDENLKKTVLQSSVQSYSGYSFPKVMRRVKESYLAIVYEYLELHGFCASQNHGAALAWYFMSVVDKKLFIDEETFYAETVKKTSYTDYHIFVGDRGRKVIEKFFKSSKRRSEKNS
jgi:hypothetical protein